VKAHRQYVREQLSKDPRFAEDLAEASAEARLAVALARMREERGWSQRKLAEITGMKQPQIARLERSGQTPSLETLWRLASAFEAQIVIGPGYFVALQPAPNSARRQGHPSRAAAS